MLGNKWRQPERCAFENIVPLLLETVANLSAYRSHETAEALKIPLIHKWR